MFKRVLQIRIILSQNY